MQTPTLDDPAFPVQSGDGDGQAAPRAADALARGMDAAASALHGRAETLPGGDKIVRAAHDAADAMETAAAYVREQDLKAMMADVRQMARRHPGATLLVAAAAGFLLARRFSHH